MRCWPVALAVVSLAGFTQIASAADLPRKAPIAPPVVAPTWSGFYVGLNAGYAWGNAKTDVIGIDSSNVIPAQNIGSLPTAFDPDVNSFIGGGQIGYNWQASQFVFGIEADIAYINLHADSIYAVGVIGFNPPLTTTQSSRLRWLGTVRPRVGWLVTPSVMVFGTGGLAYGDAEGSTNVIAGAAGTCPLTNGFCAVGSDSKVLFGWTAGAGVETLFARNWTAKIEGLYFDLGRLEYPIISTANFGVGGTETMRASTRFNGGIVRVGLNYKFN